MNGGPRYLIDSDVLVRAKHIDYPFHRVSIFWKWIEAGYSAGRFFSIDKVRSEISRTDPKVDDPLRDWAKQDKLDGFFLPSKTSLVHWADIANWVNDRSYFPAAKAKFLHENSADAWLISVAKASAAFEIVTNEAPAPHSKKDIKIPDVAHAMGIKTVSLRQLMELHAEDNLVFKP